MKEVKNKNVELLMGEPKKAIMKLSVPMILSNFVFSLYNLADGIWVAGLGPDALSAIGIFFPIFFILIALSFGISVGANSAVSRRIGAGNYSDASLVASHVIAVALLISFPITAITVILEPIMALLGADGNVLRLSVEYGKIIILGSFFLFFSTASMGILNGEGNARMAMYANIAGSLLNIVIDPVFIYLLNLGVSGAAYASVLSMIISSAVFAYWFFSKKTFVKPPIRFKVSSRILLDLLRVGMPSSASMLTMSFAFILLNRIVVETGGTEGLAAYTAAWRLIYFGFVPLFGTSAALTAVSGAAYGARDAMKIGKSHNYAVKLLLGIEGLILLAMVAFAPQISVVFAYTQASAKIYEEVVRTIRITSFVLIFSPLGSSSAAVFQGMGKGERSLAVTVLRALVFQVSLAYILAVPLGYNGVLAGFVLGEALGCFIGFGWAKFTVRRLLRAGY